MELIDIMFLNAVPGVLFTKAFMPAEELYDLNNDLHKTNNIANDPAYDDVLERHRQILTEWIKKTDDKGQYGEPDPALKVIVERWGEKCVNPEYDGVKQNEKNN